MGRPAEDAEAFRTLMSAFPTGVAVVTSLDDGAGPRGATCSSLCSVTLSPPTLLVCLTSTSSTLAAIRERGGFAVNLLHSGARDTARTFATPVADRFATVPWEPFGSRGLPWLVRDAFAVAECRADELTVVGSHAVLLGAVLGSRFTEGVPLLYGLHQFVEWQPEYEDGHFTPEPAAPSTPSVSATASARGPGSPGCPR
ncbi:MULTISPECIES: flavin reductase family protein [unclassified Streptomyces]|uniref:flavin reductase family protein n=1 Tax=unclassified Streptomyces TaxID=2593676 RepID=UPI00278C7673|nr:MULTISPECIES: flavin reductase family protein [unclassified Streptomyces]